MDKKIKLTYYDLEDNIAIESIWATKEGNYYRVKNTPFFAPNLAYNDLISVEEDQGELHFDELIKASGHSTVQIVILKKEDVQTITEKLIQLNCNWEGSHLETYISVDIPSNTDYNKVKQFLDALHKDGKLDYNEACLAHS